MPGVTVLPNTPGSPGLGGFGTPQLGKRIPLLSDSGQQTRATSATQNRTGRYYDGMTASAIKEQAIESVQRETRGITPTSLIKTARTQYDIGRDHEKSDLKTSYAAYIKAASLTKRALESPENQRGNVLWKEIGEFTSVYADLGQRLGQVEEKLKELERAKVDTTNGLPNKPGGSISDRVRALQGNGLSDGTTKRFSRTHQDMTPPGSPKQVSIHISTPPASFTTVIPSAPVSSAPSPHTLVSPSSFGPPSPPSTPSSPQLDAFNLSEFAQSFPSIEEFDETPAFHLPSVPSGIPKSNDTLNAEFTSSKATQNNTSYSQSSHINSPSSTVNLSSGRSGTPTRPSFSHQSSGLSILNSKPIIPVSETTTPRELSSYLQLYKVLLLDVRNQADFERAHIRSATAAIVCVEPSILQRRGLTLDDLEMSVATNDRSVFSNREKFDLVVIYDDDSRTLGPRDSPLSVLHSLIGEQSAQKLLKRRPMLLTGGLNAWQREFDEPWASDSMSVTSPELRPSSSSSTANFGSRNPFLTNGIHPAPSQNPSPPNLPFMPNSPFHLPNPSLDQNASHTRYAAEASYPTNLPAPTAGLNRRPAITRPGSNSISYTRSSENIPSAAQHITFPPGQISYPVLGQQISPSRSSSGLSSSPAPFSQFDITSPPQASINPSTLSRRRTDFIDQSQEAISNLQTRKPIDYPELSAPPVIRPPPLAASSTLERQDSRPRFHNVSTPFSPTGPEPPRVRYEYPPSYWLDAQISVAGLKNLANTCYMNAPIQCLSATVPFARFFTDGRWKTAINHTNPLGSQGKLAHAFSGLVSQMWSSKVSWLSPDEFRQTICALKSQYRGSDQHDSQEFLSFLLDGIHEDLNRILVKPSTTTSPEREAELERLPMQIASDQEWCIWRSRNDSLIVDFFQGQFQNRLRCLTCETTSTTYNVFSILQLPIPLGRGGEVSLRHCMDAFFVEEVLEKDDAWDCPKCKVKRRATKKLSFARLPPILVIHLKRFGTNGGTSSKKIDTFVDFPMKALDLTDYMPPPSLHRVEPVAGLSTSPEDPRTQVPPYRYDLYGVTNHSGTLSGGHYTANVASRGGWMYCDDSIITPSDPKSVVNRQAYVLFYKRTKV